MLNRSLLLVVVSLFLASPALAQNVKITPVGSHPGELCAAEPGPITQLRTAWVAAGGELFEVGSPIAVRIAVGGVGHQDHLQRARGFARLAEPKLVL